MRLPEAYRSLPRPSSSFKPSHSSYSVSASIFEKLLQWKTYATMYDDNRFYTTSSVQRYNLNRGRHFSDRSFTFFEIQSHSIHSKEVIRPQVPLRPPCYDFSPLVEPRFDNIKKILPPPNPTRVKRRAVCARSRDVFTAR